jgi:hypothetical protein
LENSLARLDNLVLEKRGICFECKRPMVSNQELMWLAGTLIHRACMPGPELKKPNTFHD